MKLQDFPINLYYIHTKEDREYCKGFEDVVRILQNEKTIQSSYSDEIDLFYQESTSSKDAIEKCDLAICLVSTHFLALKPQITPISRLLTFHRQLRAPLSYVLLSHCDAEIPPFPELDCLNPIHRPVFSKYWDNQDEAYHEILFEMRSVILQIRERKLRMEQEWESIKDDLEEEDFYAFKKKYPYSKHVEANEGKFIAEADKQLIEKANENQHISDFLELLHQGRLLNQKFLKQVKQNIQVIQSDEDRIWEDAQNHDFLELYLAYYRRFPTGKYREEAYKKIEEFLKAPLELNEKKGKITLIKEEKELDVNSHFIAYRLNEDLYGAEKFAMDIILPFCNRKYIEIKTVAKAAGSENNELFKPRGKPDWFLISFVSFFSIFILGFLIYEYGFITVLTWLTGAATVIGSTYGIFYYGINPWVNPKDSDLEAFIKRAKKLEHPVQKLEIAYLNHDILAVDQILREILELDQMLQKKIFPKHPAHKKRIDDLDKKKKNWFF